MPIKQYKPTTPSQRFAKLLDVSHLSKKRPEKSLTKALPSKAGRSHGKISVRGRGGQQKRLYRVIDFKRHDKIGVSAEVIALEFDPNRSAHIALVKYNDGEKRYILAPDGLSIGDNVEAGPDAKARVGNALPLGAIPVGTSVHNIEINAGQGGIMARTAGNAAVLMAKEGEWVHIRLSSGEVRLVRKTNYASIGQVSNSEHAQIVLGKAGRKRRLGRRPKVRGTAMAAGDHPHGGGEGRTGTGRIPRTYKGKLAYGVRTRKKNKPSDKLIVKTRRSK